MAEKKTVLGANASAAVWLVNEADEVLLQLRGSHERVAPGKWCLPGGRVAKGETAAAVVQMRLQNELGVSADVAAGMTHNANFRQDWVSDGYGHVVSFSLILPQLRYGLSTFCAYKALHVPAVGFFSREGLVGMMEDGELHPATAYAVAQSITDDGFPVASGDRQA